ncbi:MAG TPA: type II toxin-antitoxin system VapC family toxin [Thiolapillus brandeum]|uniref:Ribonuclease VapC n=1 Tax=Thiolapillus brandeum TaxID=1076588 RepID=A0A7C5IZU5_9GAMM|nr:type II toxin-antitoxin system VapC family toxin [Thiolapillus brandeum]
MAVLVDTCGWIEWLTDGELADAYSPNLLQPEEVIVPTSVQFELYKWVCREASEREALEVIGLTEQAQVVPLNSRIALLAAELAREHDLSFADSIIYGTARSHQARLVTSDSHFEGLPGVELFSKKPER